MIGGRAPNSLQNGRPMSPPRQTDPKIRTF